MIFWQMYAVISNNYIRLDVLKNGADEFEDSDEVYEAIGEVLHEISEDKSEDEIR